MKINALFNSSMCRSVKGYGFLSFDKNMSKNIGKDLSKNLSGIYSQKLPGHTKQSATDALKKASKKVIQIAAEATCHLIGNKIANRITKASKSSPQNSSETIASEYDKELPKERNISPEKRQKVIDDIREI